MFNRLIRQSFNSATRARFARMANSVQALLLCCTAAPAGAQMDLSGTWTAIPAQANSDTPLVGDYAGLPLNPAALRRAETWDAAIESLPIWQCRPPSAATIKQSSTSLRITQLADPASQEVSAFQAAWPHSNGVQIFTDGRSHPPAHANHTWSGYSTARWLGPVLRIRTTHLKDGYYRSNGVPQSDRTQLTEYVIRRSFRGQDYLTWVVIADDPVYLSEQLIRSSDFRYDPAQSLTPIPCAIIRPANGSGAEVPFLLPGANSQLGSFATAYDLPPRVTADGALTMYPEYRTVLANWRTGAARREQGTPGGQR
jgi:hypothetical protein